MIEITCSFCTSRLPMLARDNESACGIYLLHLITFHWEIMEMTRKAIIQGTNSQDLDNQLERLHVR